MVVTILYWNSAPAKGSSIDTHCILVQTAEDISRRKLLPWLYIVVASEIISLWYTDPSVYWQVCKILMALCFSGWNISQDQYLVFKSASDLNTILAGNITKVLFLQTFQPILCSISCAGCSIIECRSNSCIPSPWSMPVWLFYGFF